MVQDKTKEWYNRRYNWDIGPAPSQFMFTDEDDRTTRVSPTPSEQWGQRLWRMTYKSERNRCWKNSVGWQGTWWSNQQWASHDFTFRKGEKSGVEMRAVPQCAHFWHVLLAALHFSLLLAVILSRYNYILLNPNKLQLNPEHNITLTNWSMLSTCWNEIHGRIRKPTVFISPTS